MRKLLRFSMMLCLMLVSVTASAWKFTVNTPAEGKVKELFQIVLNEPEGTIFVDEFSSMPCTLTCNDGTSYTYNMSDDMAQHVSGTPFGTAEIRTPGTYTLTIPAGTFHINGEGNEAFEASWTIEGGSQDSGDGDFDGEKWQEVIFKAGETSVTTPITFDTKGMSLSTVGKPFMDIILDVAYNTYGGKEIDWNGGTKLVITAKDNISGIVMKGNNLGYGSADKGNYTNGSWVGALMAGEVLTLTANEGITLDEIIVLYNGDEYNAEEKEDDKGVITIQYPTENMLWATFNNGNKLATFTTNKEYAQVIIDIEDLDPNFNNLYKFPTRMVDNNGEKSDNLHVGENTVTAQTPDAKPWSFFKDHTYKLIVRGYVNMWDQQDDYDAIAEVTFIGDGVEAETLSDVTVDKIFPANGTELPVGPRTVDITFSDPVKTLKAVQPKGMEGSTTYACTKVDEEGRIWNVNLGSLSIVSESGESSSITLEISGTDAEGNVLNLGDNAARALILAYTISKTATEPEPEADELAVSLVYEGGEYALNGHSTVTIAEPITGIKVSGIDASVKEASYAILGTDKATLAAGELSLHGVGTANFAPVTMEEAMQYNVVIYTDGKSVFDQVVYGAYEPEVIEISAEINDGEQNITLNSHSAVSAEAIKSIKVTFDGIVPTQAGYSLNTLKAIDGQEGTTWEIDATIAQGDLQLSGVGYAELDEAIILNSGTMYALIINADNESATFEINGAYEEAIEIAASFINGEEEIALNSHSAVSVEGADALKAAFSNGGATVKYATYTISEMVEEEWFGVTETVPVEVASGILTLNGFGYVEFDQPLVFNYGSKYNVSLKAWDVPFEELFDENFNMAAPIATIECDFNGSFGEPAPEPGMEIAASFIIGEEEYALNSHSAVSVEGAEALKATFSKNADAVKYASYTISEMVEEEWFGVTETVPVEVASGILTLNGFGYAEFDQPLVFNYGSKYNVSIKAWDVPFEELFDENFNMAAPIATIECDFNGSFGEPTPELATVAIEEGDGVYTVTSTSEDAALYYLCKPMSWLEKGETPESCLENAIEGMGSMIDSEETWEMYEHMGCTPAPKTFTVADYQEMYAGEPMFLIAANIGWDGEKLGVISNIATTTFIVPDITTAIDGIAAEAIADGKYLENGKVVIVKNGVKYNAAGQIVK